MPNNSCCRNVAARCTAQPVPTTASHLVVLHLAFLAARTQDLRGAKAADVAAQQKGASGRGTQQACERHVAQDSAMQRATNSEEPIVPFPDTHSSSSPMTSTMAPPCSQSGGGGKVWPAMDTPWTWSSSAKATLHARATRCLVCRCSGAPVVYFCLFLPRPRPHPWAVQMFGHLATHRSPLQHGACTHRAWRTPCRGLASENKGVPIGPGQQAGTMLLLLAASKCC